jgi:hypothetical protein
LWEEHDVWTRDTITAIVFGLPNLDFVIARLLRNPTDFARVFRVFYSDEIANRFEALLREHLVLAAELVTAAKAGDTEAAARIEKQWYANAEAIAEFLGRINSFWSTEEWREMMFEHLRLVKTEAVSLLTGDYATNVSVYDEIEAQTLEMADELSRGIMMQFNIGCFSFDCN